MFCKIFDQVTKSCLPYFTQRFYYVFDPFNSVVSPLYLVNNLALGCLKGTGAGHHIQQLEVLYGKSSSAWTAVAETTSRIAELSKQKASKQEEVDAIDRENASIKAPKHESCSLLHNLQL